MTCPKCGGLVVAGESSDEAKCVSCGKRFYPHIPITPQEEPTMTSQSTREPERVTTTRGWSPERRAKFTATQAKKRQANETPPAQVAQPKKAGEGPLPTEATAQEATWSDWKSSLLAQLAEAEATLHTKLTRIQTAKASIEAL